MMTVGFVRGLLICTIIVNIIVAIKIYNSIDK